MKRNRYKLISGGWSRWEGAGKKGVRVRYSPTPGNDIIENVTDGELAVLGARLVLVAGVSPGPTVPAIEELPDTDEVPDAVAAEDGEPTTADDVGVEEAPTEDADYTSWKEIVNSPLKEVVAAINVLEDLDDLVALRKEEMKKLKRKGVLNAIEDRRAVLKAGV